MTRRRFMSAVSNAVCGGVLAAGLGPLAGGCAWDEGPGLIAKGRQLGFTATTWHLESLRSFRKYQKTFLVKLAKEKIGELRWATQ